MKFNPVDSRDLGENPFVEIPQFQRMFLVGCVVAYCFLLIFLVACDGGFGSSSRGLLLLSSLALVITVALPLVLKIRSSGFLHPLVLTSAFALQSMVLSRTVLMTQGMRYHAALPSMSVANLDNLIALVNLLMICGYLSKYAGYYSAGKMGLPAIRFSKTPNSLFLPLLLGWFFLGALAMLYIIRASGGINYHLINLNRGHAARVFESGTKLLGACAMITQSTIVIPMLYAAFRKNGHRSLIFVLLVLASAIMAYLNAGRRSAVLMPACFAIAVWIYKERQLPLVRISLLAVLLFFFLSVGSVWRQSNRRFTNGIDWRFLSGYSVSELAEKSMDELAARSGGAAPIFPIIVHVPNRIPYNYFKSYLENFYRVIPRAIWRDKPRGIGIETAEVFYHRIDQGGIPPGEYGEAYWSLGVLGVILVFFGHGVVLRVAGNELLRNPTATGVFVVYTLTVFRLGPDQISFRVWIFSVAPLAVFLMATGLMSFKGRS